MLPNLTELKLEECVAVSSPSPSDADAATEAAGPLQGSYRLQRLTIVPSVGKRDNNGPGSTDAWKPVLSQLSGLPGLSSLTLGAGRYPTDFLPALHAHLTHLSLTWWQAETEDMKVRPSIAATTARTYTLLFGPNHAHIPCCPGPRRMLALSTVPRMHQSSQYPWYTVHSAVPARLLCACMCAYACVFLCVYTSPSQEAIRHVSQVSSLQHLELSHCTGHALAPLSRLPHLRELKLSFCGEEDHLFESGVAGVFKCGHVTSLNWWQDRPGHLEGDYRGYPCPLTLLTLVPVSPQVGVACSTHWAHMNGHISTAGTGAIQSAHRTESMAYRKHRAHRWRMAHA